jgi:hypothetical protein
MTELQALQIESAIMQLARNKERSAQPPPRKSHAILTCANHPDLRWSCKSIAWSEGDPGCYNGSRNIFFFGNAEGEYVRECQCPGRDLRLVGYED